MSSSDLKSNIHCQEISNKANNFYNDFKSSFNLG